MAARVKQQNIIYSSLAESMLDGEIKIDDNYWS
jgi:acid stress-induced BolA-like protein IbaG/YrbA